MKISTPLNQIYRLHLSFKQLLLGDFWGERNYLPEAIRHYFFYPNHAREKSSLRCYKNKHNVITL